MKHAQAQGVIQWEKPDKTSWKDRKEMLYDDLFESLGPVERLVKAATERMGKKKLDAIVDPAVAFRLFRGYYGRAITMIEGEGQKAVEGLKRNFPGVDFTGFKTLHTILKEIDAFQNKERQKSFITYCTARHLLDMHGKNDQLAKDKQEAADDVTARENAWRKEYRSLGEEKKRLSTLEKNVAALEKAVNSNSRDTVASKEALDEMKQDLKESRKAVKEKQKTVDKLFRELGQARKRVDDLEGKKPMEIPDAYSKENCEKIIQKGDEEFRQAQQDLVHFSNTTAAILYDSGVISAKRYRSLVETWPNYVPLHRVFEENEEIDFGDSLKKIKGSQRDIVNPLESIIRNTVDFVKRAEKNKAKCLLADLARCDGTGWLIEEVEDTKPGDKTTITFYENGERKYLQTDPAVVKAINYMDRRNSSTVMKFLHAITSVARACFTMANPEFAIRNVACDYADALLYNKNGFISPMDMIRAYMNAIKKDETYYEWLSSGAAQASAVSLDRNYTQEMIDKMGRSWKKRFMSKSFPQAMLEALQKAGEYSEYATRIAMYTKNKEHLSARESKGDAYAAIIGAAFESRDLMDFARQGEGGADWNKLVPFANASLQGLNKFYREALDPVKWRENPKEMTRTWARLTLSSILPAMMLFLWNKDEDWYRELPDWVKEGHWCFKLGDTVIRIPKGSDVGIRFLSNAVEKGMAEASKRDSYKAKDYFRPLWDALPNFIPIAMLPLLEARLNKSLFTGRNIVPQHQEKLPGKLQYGPYTTGFSKVIGEKLGIAPSKIDHVITGYGGSLGIFPFKAADVLWGDRQLDTSMEEMPLTRSLLYMPYKNPKSVQRYCQRLPLNASRLKRELATARK